ncbi:MAG: glutamine--fructose-6-phosphate aminotransferase, partial [Myxococcota bacterium]|nr:glutamine--fructose-6-phosphate aminotransferase [Myxococcota bacterium]
DEVMRAFRALSQRIEEALELAQAEGLSLAAARRLSHALADASLQPSATPFSLRSDEKKVFDEVVSKVDLLRELYEDYPLVFVTSSDPTDVGLTVSQVNTHKIRGACCVMIAEENAALRQAVSRPPADNPYYRSSYIRLPRTDDKLMLFFSATVVLQRLALRMSLLKQEYLERLGFDGHGVHPDVPKNVSKSITVD